MYDAAFRELTEAVKQWQLIAGQGPNRTTQSQTDVRIGAATLVVRSRRDALARFLMTAEESCASNSHLQDAAYFIWFNAGCPSGTAASDWLAAEKQLLHA